MAGSGRNKQKKVYKNKYLLTPQNVTGKGVLSSVTQNEAAVTLTLLNINGITTSWIQLLLDIQKNCNMCKRDVYCGHDNCFRNRNAILKRKTKSFNSRTLVGNTV